MASWLRKSNNNGNKPIVDGVEAAVKTNANKVFENVFGVLYLSCKFV